MLEIREVLRSQNRRNLIEVVRGENQCLQIPEVLEVLVKFGKPHRKALEMLEIGQFGEILA